ncbi:Cilia- and flagella-associated protein 47, partial [Geodia barretti]
GRRGGVGRCTVGFVSEESGQFECRVVLRSSREVRVFIIESTVLERCREVQLEFTTTAMQPLTQDIPIVNPSTVEWLLGATLRGSGFSGPDSILSQPLSTTAYPLTFNPKKEGTVEGELCLVNGNDGTEHRFQLRGVAEKPLAQDYVLIHTRAKTSVTHILHVPNHNERTTEFRVESDLTCVSGPPSVTITGGDLVDYPLLVRPIRRGVVSGAVAFVAQAPGTRDRRSLSAVSSRRGQASSAPHHVWFQIEVRAEPAPPDQVVPLTCPTLSSTLTRLHVTNSQPHPLQLTVVVGGEYVSGPGSLVVDANSSTSYPLTFAPSLIGDTAGEVVFDGGPDGEFWYQLQLTATDPTPITLPNVTCKLGKTEQVSVPLRNPLGHSVVFSCQCSNTRHFIIPALTDSQVEVEAGGSIDVPVLFKPSCVGSGDHMAHISFTSQQFGEQVFILQGEGSEPSQMEPTTIQASLNSNTTHVVSFTNPLDTPTLFQVTLCDTHPLESFCLLLKRTHGILLRPGVSLDIPVMFVPEEMHTHRTNMTVSTEGTRSENKLVWRYPIIGQPQFSPLSPKSAPKIVCQAKERVEEKLEVMLVSRKMKDAAIFRSKAPNLDTSSGNDQGLPQQSEADGHYSYELVCVDGEYSDLIRDCVVVKLLRRVVSEEGHVKLVFGFVFVPPRALSCTVELNVRCSGSGGVWKFPLHLCANMADPDDVIVIEATSLNRETQIQFRLTSMQEHPLPFTAHLAHGVRP